VKVKHISETLMTFFLWRRHFFAGHRQGSTFEQTQCTISTDCCDRKSRAACAQSFAPWQ